MYQSTSSSSSSQKSMGPSGGDGGGGGSLTRYGSAPGSLLTSAVDSVIGRHHPDSAASLRSPPSFAGHYFSADSSVESSSKVVPSSTSNDLKSTNRALNRAYGNIHELALGDFSTARNYNGNGGHTSSLVRQRSSPAGFLGHLTVAEGNGFSLTRETGNYGSQNGSGNHGVARLKSQLSFTGQDSLSQISEISESVVEGSSNGIQNSTRSFVSNNSFGNGMESWDSANSIVFAPPHSQGKRLKHSDGDIYNCFTGLETQFSLPQTTLEMATVERLLQIPEDSVPCKIRAKRGCATHPRSIAERERRTRISGKLKKLQDLVPNMDKQTSYSDMLDLAVQHIKGLQKQIQNLQHEVENCTCGCKQSS